MPQFVELKKSKMSKPKGKTPSLISGASGKPEAVRALKKSHCARCHSDILKDERCFDIPKTSGPFKSTKRYCTGCFTSILEQTDKDIDELKVFVMVTKFPENIETETVKLASDDL